MLTPQIIIYLCLSIIFIPVFHILFLIFLDQNVVIIKNKTKKI
jgi:hypothetical protein